MRDAIERTNKDVVVTVDGCNGKLASQIGMCGAADFEYLDGQDVVVLGTDGCVDCLNCGHRALEADLRYWFSGAKACFAKI